MKTNLLKGGKRLLSIILAICLMASVCSTGISFAVSAEETTASSVNAVDYWDGTTTDNSFISGDGSETNPYIITSAAEVYTMLYQTSLYGKYFKVADGITDFYFNAVEGKTQSESKAFFEDSTIAKNDWYNTIYNTSGYLRDQYVHFDGNGVTLHGIYANTESSYGVAFISKTTKDTSVKNVTFNNCYFKNTGSNASYSGAGVVIGTTSGAHTVDIDNVKITNCTVIGDGTTAATNGDAALVCGNKAQNSAVNISNVITYGNSLTGTAQVGVLVGGGWKGGTSDSFTASNIISMDNVAIVSNTTYLRNTGIGTYDFVYTYADIPSNLATDTKGIYSVSTLDEMTGIAWNLEWFVDESGYPYFVDSDIKYEVWDGTADTDFATADGEAMSETNPYIITSAEELYGMVDSQGSSGAYFKVSDDIDVFLLNPVYGMDAASARTYFADSTITKKAWLSSNSKTFNGTFDGNGATIVGLYSYSDGSTNSIATGFIPRLGGTAATVENIAFDKCYSYSGATSEWNFGGAGIVFGCVRNASTTALLENVQITNSTVNTAGVGAGLVVGSFRTDNGPTLSVTNLVTSGNVVSSGNDYNGVFAGMHEKGTFTATNCILADADIKTTGRTSTFFASINLTNVYTACTSSNSGTYNYTLTNTKGYAAYASASALDWADTFTAEDGEYPELKLFAFGDNILYSGGSGTEADPYLIANAIDLQMMVKFNGYVPTYDSSTDTYSIGTTQAYHKLINDIDINGVKDMTTAEAFTYLTASGSTWDNTDYTGTSGIFVGNIDGDHHTIYGFYNTSSTPSMFYKIGASSVEVVIENLAVRKSYVTSTSRGLLFAYQAAGTTTFSNCAVTDTYLSGTSVAWVFQAASGTVTFENCATVTDSETGAVFTNTTATNSYSGGFLGDGWSTAMVFNNCISIGILPMDTLMTSSNFYAARVTYSNVYTDVDYTAVANYASKQTNVDAKFVAGAMEYIPAGTTENDEKMWLDVDYDTYLAHDTWGGEDGLIDPADFTKKNFERWDGSSDTTWEGSGTEDDPYIITSAEELYGMVQSGGNGKYYRVADGISEMYFNDIKGMSASEAVTFFEGEDTKNTWSTTADFNGHFDGNGVKLIGLYNTSSSYTAFIPRVNGGTADIKNVHFDKCYFTSSQTSNWRNAAAVVVGGSVNAAASKIILDSIIVSDSYVGCTYGAAVVGGLAGSNTLTASNILTYGNTISGGTNTTASILGDIYTTNGTSYPITVNISNVVSADSVNVVANQAAKLSEDLTNYVNTYSNVYAVAWPSNVTADASHYTVLTAEQMQGDAALENITNLSSDWVFIRESYPVPAVFHTHVWGDTEVITSECQGGTDIEYKPCATCYANLVDGEVISGTLSAVGHVDNGTAYDATYHWTTCANCDVQINKLAHSYGEWYKNTDGVMQRDCECGYSDILDYGYWDGTADTDWEGSGTEASPYILYTAEEVYGMITSGGNGAYYKVADGVTELYFNPIKGMDKTAAMSYLAASGRQWFTSQTTFDGHFDGNGAKLIGLTSTASSGYNAFINIVAHGSAASVKNVTFDRCYFVSTGAVANSPWGHGASVIFGKVGGTSAASDVDPANVAVSNVMVKNSTVTSNGGAALIFGFAGYAAQSIDFVLTENNTVTTANEHTNATTAASIIIGGAGAGFRNTDTVAASSISNCIFTETDIDYFPAAAYANYSFGTINAIYTAGANDSGNKATIVTQDQMKGAGAETNMSGLAWGMGWMPGAEGEYPVFGSYDYTFWNGTAATDWAGSGTENDPYIIETAEQLYGMVQSGGMVDGKSAYFKVKDGVEELYLTAIKDKTVAEAQTFLSTKGSNWYDGTTNTEFVGKFDGNGVRLIGMKSTTTGTSNYNNGVGFVEKLGANAVIKNVHFDMPYVTSQGGSAATITTYTTGANIMVMNVAVTNAYIANGAVTNVYSGVAGILYQHDSYTPMTLANCLFEGTLVNNNPNTNASTADATDNTAGIVATPDSWGSGVIVDNCISIGYKPVGANTASYTVFNTYTTVACDFAGVIANTPVANLTKASATSLSWMHWTENAFTTYANGTVPMPIINESWSSDNWNVKGATTSIISDYGIFDGGNGTEAKPYGISTPEQLYKAIFSGGERYGAPLYFRLTKNIDLGGGTWLSSDITGYVPFSGVLDGNGHTVKGLSSVGENAGLIPVAVSGAVIKDIHLENAYASGTTAAGALVGAVSDGGTITVTNVSVINGDVSGATAGGIIGSAGTTTINNVYYIGTVSTGYGIVGTDSATLGTGYTTLTDAAPVEYEGFITGAELGKIKASQLGDDWYQGDYTLFFPRLKSWAKSQKTLDMAGDGETSSYNAEDLAAMRSNLLYRSAFKSIYGDITYDNKVDIRDLAVLKRSAAGSYADIDEGFWPNVAQGEYTIVYENNDNRDAATRLQNYFAEKFGVELSVVYTQAEGAELPTQQIIAVGDVAALNLACSSQNVPAFGLDTSMHTQEGNYIIWFDSAFVTGVEETVDLFKQYAEVNKSLPEIEGSFWEENNYVNVTLDGEVLLNLDAETGYKSYKQIKWIDGVKYNYVWGDEFDQTYDTDSTVDGAYGYDHNTWKVSHSLNFFTDIEVAMPEDIQNFTYVKDGKLVMRNDVSGNYWNDKVGQHNGFKEITSSHKYATGGTFDTAKSMIFKRGYAELVAQVPNDTHVFPAWWLYGNTTIHNMSLDDSLYGKVYELNPNYDGSTLSPDKTNGATFKYLVPYATIEIDIFEVMNTTAAVLWWDSATTSYGSTVHKRYMNTVTDSKIYDIFGKYGTAGAEYTPSVSGYTADTNTATEQSWVKRDSNSYNASQSYSERTYYFLWTETTLSFWDSDNTTKRTVDITDDTDYEVYLYMLLDNHFYSPASGSNSTGATPEQELIVDSVRLYQAAGQRALITPESKAINGTDN